MENLTREEEITKVKEIQAKINKAMSLLGFKPEKKEDEMFYRVADNFKKGDERLFVSASNYLKWKLEIRGSYPRDSKGQYVEPYKYGEKHTDSINVSSEKSPEQIAKDIERRLLPEYRLRLAKVQELINSWKKQEDTTLETLTELKGWGPTEQERDSKQFSLNLEKGYGHVKVSGNEVSIDLSYIDKELAKKILALIPKEEKVL